MGASASASRLRSFSIQRSSSATSPSALDVSIRDRAHAAYEGGSCLVCAASAYIYVTQCCRSATIESRCSAVRSANPLQASKQTDLASSRPAFVASGPSVRAARAHLIAVLVHSRAEWIAGRVGRSIQCLSSRFTNSSTIITCPFARPRRRAISFRPGIIAANACAPHEASAGTSSCRSLSSCCGRAARA